MNAVLLPETNNSNANGKVVSLNYIPRKAATLTQYCELIAIKEFIELSSSQIVSNKVSNKDQYS